jgi:predicted lipoprotein with Yx(FWY)xxD motif
MRTRPNVIRLLPVLSAGALVLTACGGSSAGNSAAADRTTTVELHASKAGTVLTADNGHTLYVSDQENHRVLCASSACTAVWRPLTVPAGTNPSAPPQLSSHVSTVTRPDGRPQVALDGKPLYTFAFDHSAGDVGGNGQRDSFDGTSFTWHTATVSSASQPAPSKSGNSGSGY